MMRSFYQQPVLRREQGMDLVELRIVVIVIAILMLISIPVFFVFSARLKQRREAVDTLRARLAGTAVPALPDTEVVVRDGVRGLRQKLPPLPPELQGDGFAVRLEGAAVVVGSRWWARWLLGPFVILAFLAATATTAWEWFDRHEEGRQKLAGIAFCLAAVLVCLSMSYGVTRWEVDGPRARLMRTDTAFGIRVWPVSVHENLAGIAAVPAGGPYAVTAFLQDGKDVELFRVAADSRGVAGRLNDALGRR